MLLCATSSVDIDWTLLAIVLVVIGAFVLVIRGVAVIAERTHPSARETSPPPVRSSAPAAAPAPELTTPELVAVLTAAATTVLGRSVRVLGIREIAASNTRDQQSWSREGRREIYLSHRIR